MPVKLVDLEQDRRTVEIKVEVPTANPGEVTVETVTLTYKPSVFTPKRERELSKIIASPEERWSYVPTFLAEILVKWDLLGEDNKPLPLDVESIASVPDWFSAKLITEIGDDMGKKVGR